MSTTGLNNRNRIKFVFKYQSTLVKTAIKCFYNSSFYHSGQPDLTLAKW